MNGLTGKIRRPGLRPAFLSGNKDENRFFRPPPQPARLLDPYLQPLRRRRQTPDTHGTHCIFAPIKDKRTIKDPWSPASHQFWRQGVTTVHDPYRQHPGVVISLLRLPGCRCALPLATRIASLQDARRGERPRIRDAGRRMDGTCPCREEDGGEVWPRPPGRVVLFVRPDKKRPSREAGEPSKRMSSPNNTHLIQH